MLMCVYRYHVSFVGMVLPEDKITLKIEHVGMHKGLKLIKFEAFRQSDIKVLEGTAEIDQCPTCYVFTGQGSQYQGMGMDLYDSSLVYRKVWDRADHHFRQVLGVSLLEIVRHNPKQYTVYFGGTQGEKIKTNYRNMTSTVVDENGHCQTVPLFPQITDESESFTFQHPTGLINATQFTQAVLVVHAKATFEYLKSLGLIQENTLFAGHR